MDAKTLAALGNGMAHIIRALPHNEQLGLMMALNEAVLSPHGAGCALLVFDDMSRWINELAATGPAVEPETDPLKIN
jgi:hypothetical protein